MNSEAKSGSYYLVFRMIIAFLILLSLGLIYAWSVIRTPLTDIFPNWSATQLSGVFSVSMIFFIAGGLLGGWTQTRFSERLCLIIGGLLIGTGFYGTSMMDINDPQRSLLMLYFFYGVLATLGVGFAYNVCISVMVKWFPHRVGLISGALLMAFGIGAFLLGSTELALIAKVGVLVSFRILAVGNFVLVMLGAAVIRLPREDELAVLDKTVIEDQHEEIIEYSPREMIRDRSYQLFFLWSMCIRVSGLTAINSAATIMLFYGGPAVLGLIVTLANGLVRPVMGSLFDNLGRRRAMAINLFFAVGGAALLLGGAGCKSIILLACGLVLAGLGYGSTTTISSSYVMSYGRKYYSIDVAITNVAVLASALIGPLLSGWLQDSSNGDYLTTFMMMLFFSLFSVIICAMLIRVDMKKELLNQADDEESVNNDSDDPADCCTYDIDAENKIYDNSVGDLK